MAGPYSGANGFLSYYEICDKINNGMTVVQDNAAQAPYGYQGNFWVGYDDEASLRHKVKTLVKSRKLKGVLFWTLDYDDFTGSYCGKGKYPLISAVKNELETKGGHRCFGINAWYGNKNIDEWCGINCAACYCPTTHCSCNSKRRPKNCKATGFWYGNKDMDKWCSYHCPIGNCPLSQCRCE